MQPYFRRPPIVMIIWCLLFVGLFLASVALADQMNLLTETCTQDEYALSQVSSVLKSKLQPYASCVSASLATGASAPSCLASPDEPRWAHYVTSLAFPALPLHQRLSIYRI